LAEVQASAISGDLKPKKIGEIAQIFNFEVMGKNGEWISSAFLPVSIKSST